MPVLEARGIVKLLGVGRAERRILDGADLDVDTGEVVAVLGRSGSGKSTPPTWKPRAGARRASPVGDSTAMSRCAYTVNPALAASPTVNSHSPGSGAVNASLDRRRSSSAELTGIPGMGLASLGVRGAM